MDPYLLILRLLHIVLGALWVGFAVFVPFILIPALNDAGPAAAGPLMGAVMKRGMPKIMAALAGTTILAGLLLMWHDSAGFQSEWMHTSVGRGFSLGGAIAILAFIYGMAVVRPTMEKVGKLSQGMASITSDADRAAQAASIAKLRTKGDGASKLVAWMLLLALVIMAVARYL
jgi:uncharacterized membrane protein